MPFFDARTFAEAYRIASRILSLAIGCIVPALIGHVIDRQLGSDPVGVVIGSLIGILLAIAQLRRLIGEMPGSRPKS